MFETLTEDLRRSSVNRWYTELETRDQKIVVGLILASILALLVVFVWLPLSNWSTSETQRYQNSQALLDWIKLNETQARRVASSIQSENSTKESLLAAISNSAKGANLQLLRFQEEAGGGVSVVLQDQPFSDVLRWLSSLNQQQNIQIRQLSIDAHTAPGRVNARIIFI